MKVTVVEEGTRSELLIERPVISIGRAIDNDIRLQSSQVSRHHCRIERGTEGVWVIDLGSSNGTEVNGEKIKRRLLIPGDRLHVGRAEITLRDAIVEANAGETQLISAGAAGQEPHPLVPGLITLSGEAQRERENLRVFSRIARELLRETDLGRLLRLIVDNAIALVGAERGFLLLAEPSEAEAQRDAKLDASQMRVRIARSFDREDIVVPATRLSMGIARKVAATSDALLSVDAGRDERLSGMASVEDLRLRSVMCVPIVFEGRVEGVLYVDNRLQQSAFAQDDLELLQLFADLASIALKNARLVAELKERNQRIAGSARQIELLNEQLGRKVRDRDTELAVVRAELTRERGRYDYGSIVGASEGMRRVFQQLDRILESDLPVMVQGESGTGKELIARAIHFNGPRKERPFVTENVAALPDTLLESELFGHARGAFTGAHRTKKGLLEQADGGTLFLDEIGDMSPELQKKLLRVLQEGEFRVLGSDRSVKVDVRIIAASHRNLEDLVREGRFREDLYYRVNVLSVKLPPLRERREDIPLLAEHLLARAARDAGRAVPFLPHGVIAALAAYDWPGNVRELENEMRRLVVLCADQVELEHLSQAVQERRTLLGVAQAVGVAAESSGSIREAVADLERRSIEASLKQAGGNKSKASALLGISRFALQRKLDKYGFSRAKDDEAPEDEPASADAPTTG